MNLTTTTTTTTTTNNNNNSNKDQEQWYEYIQKLVETGRESKVPYMGINK